MARPALFLDRDGTIIEEAGYLERLDRMVFYPYSVDAIRGLNRAGFAVVVITNQAGIARGIVRESFVGEAHRHIAAALGVPLTAIFGPTDERATAPAGQADVILRQVFCRPCMLRECPIDHRCMKRIDVDSVLHSVVAHLPGPARPNA